MGPMMMVRMCQKNAIEMCLGGGMEVAGELAG